jgi:ferrous iron transport protein A
VVKVALGKEVGRRLADMGFTEGVEGTVVRKGFFYGPLHIRILGYDILIRRYEASGIEVEPVGDRAVYGRVKRFGGWRRPGLSTGPAPGHEDPPREKGEP